MFRSIGCDAEIIDRVTTEILPEICVPAELAWIETLPGEQKALASTLIFTAKEAFYKCQFAVTEEWLGFEDVALDPVGWDYERREFTIAPVREVMICRQASMPLKGRFWFDDRLMIAGTWLTAE